MSVDKPESVSICFGHLTISKFFQLSLGDACGCCWKSIILIDYIITDCIYFSGFSNSCWSIA